MTSTPALSSGPPPASNDVGTSGVSPQRQPDGIQQLDHLVTLLSVSPPGLGSPRNLSRASSVAHIHSPGASPMFVGGGTPRRGVTTTAMGSGGSTDQPRSPGGPASVSTVAQTAQWLLALDEETPHAATRLEAIAAAAAPGGSESPQNAQLAAVARSPASWIASPLSVTPAGSGHWIGGPPTTTTTTTITTTTTTATATATSTTSASLSDTGYQADDECLGRSLSDEDDDDDGKDKLIKEGYEDGLSWLHETFASSLSTLLSRAPTPHRRTPPRSNTPLHSNTPNSPLDLPELLLNIFHYLTLDPPSLLAAACTCRTWSRLAIPMLYDHLELWSPYDIVHVAQTMSSLRASSKVPPTVGPRSLSFRRCENLTPALLLSLYPSTHHPPRTVLLALDLYVCPDLSTDLLPTLFPLSPPSMPLHSHPPSTLSVLRLAGCPRISDTDLLHVAHNCPLLTDLDLRACYLVSDAGVIAIARACPRLVAINVGRAIDGALISDTALVALARGCPRLALVGLAGTHVSDAGVRVLMASGARRRGLGGGGVRILCLNMCPVVTPALVIWLGRRVVGPVDHGQDQGDTRAVRITTLDTVEFRDCPQFVTATRDIDYGTARGRALWRGWCRLRRAGVGVSLPVTLLSAMHWYAVRLVDVQFAKDTDRREAVPEAQDGGSGPPARRRMGSGRAVGPLWPLLGELLGESVVESSSVGASNAPSHVWETGSAVGMPGGGLVGGGGWSSNPALGI